MRAWLADRDSIPSGAVSIQSAWATPPPCLLGAQGARFALNRGLGVPHEPHGTRVARIAHLVCNLGQRTGHAPRGPRGEISGAGPAHLGVRSNPLKVRVADRPRRTIEALHVSLGRDATRVAEVLPGGAIPAIPLILVGLGQLRCERLG